MIQSVASSSTGFDNPARFGTQSSRQTSSRSTSTNTTPTQASQLTPEQQQQLLQLKETDRKVRAHEQAHLSVGGNLVRGGATFSYQTGPDNQRYAVGGEVSIDASPGRTPKETIPKAQHIRATALAPAEPSSQDRSVAAKAARMESDARAELAAQQQEEGTSSDQGGASLYRSVENSDNYAAQLGGLLNSFA